MFRILILLLLPSFCFGQKLALNSGTTVNYRFSPMTPDNRVIWYEANNVTLGTGTEITAMQNLFGGTGATVSGVRNTPNIATDGGGNSILFTRANNEMLQSPAVTGITSYTMYVVFKANGTSSNQKIIGNGGVSTTTNGSDVIINSNTVQVSNRNSSSAGSQSFAFTETSNYHVLTVKFETNGTTTSNFISRLSYKVDNVVKLSDSDVGILQSCSAAFDIGSDASNNSFDGYIKTIILYSDWHTDTEEQNMYYYLNNKWGLSVPTTMPNYNYGTSAIAVGDAATATLGTASLYSDVFCYGNSFDATGNKMPVLILMHGYTDPATIFTDVFERQAANGFFVIAVQMRGRGSSTGSANSGGQEVYDIYDVYQKTLTNFSKYVDPNRVIVCGYSGGGGNALSFATRFPDLCPITIDHFGISDYGFDGTFSWFIEEPSRQTQLNTEVGSPRSSYLNEYYARKSVDAVAKNYKGILYIYHDDQDGTVDLDQSSRVKDAYVALSRTVKTTLYGTASSNTELLYSISTIGDTYRWTHGYPTTGSGVANTETSWVNSAKTVAIPSMPRSGTLYVRGWVKTRLFELRLGNGTTAQNGQVRGATLVYDVDANTYQITPELQTGATDLTVILTTATGGSASGTISTVTTFNP